MAFRYGGVATDNPLPLMDDEGEKEAVKLGGESAPRVMVRT